MKRLLCLSMVVFSLALPNRKGFCQWVQTNGPYGATVFCIQPFGNNIFIGTEGGVFESTDLGTTWKPVRNGLPFDGEITTLTTRGSNIFAGTYRNGIYRSTDSGDSWKVLPNSLYVQTLGSSKHAIFALGGYYYLSTSTNDGDVWMPADSDLMNITRPQAILTVDTTTYVTGAWIIQTTNDGQHWDVTAVPPSGNSWNITCLANIGEVLFAYDQNSGILRSTNHGISWYPTNNGLPQGRNPLVTLASLGNITFAGTYDGNAYRSIDSGLNWEPVSFGLPIGAEVNDLVSNGSQLLAGFRGPGVFRSYDKGTTWSDCNQGLLSISTNAIAVAGDTIFVATYGGVFRTTNNGQSWQPIRKGFTNYDVLSFLIDGEGIYAGTYDWPNPLFISTDRGENWTLPDSGLLDDNVSAMIRSGRNLIVGGDPDGNGDGFFKSIDGGLSWSPSEVYSGYSRIIAMGFLKVGTTLLAATNGGPYISYDDGSSWSESTRGFTYLQNLFTNCIELSGSNIFVSRIGPTNLDKGVIFISYDTGITWHPVADTSIPPRGSGTCFASYCNVLFLSTDSCGIFLTTDDGAHWINENHGLGDSSVLSLAVQGDELLAGTASSGVWRRPLAEMIPPSSVASEQQPSDMLSFFPNPASRLFHLMPGRAGTVRLFDLLGRTRAETYNDGTGAALDVSTLESGTYFLRVGSQSATVEIMH